MGAKTDLAMVCYLVNSDKSGDNLLETAKNKKSKSPLDLLSEEPDFPAISELLRSFKYPRRIT